MTLSYEMPLGNVQSYDASGRKGGLLKPQSTVILGEGFGQIVI